MPRRTACSLLLALAACGPTATLRVDVALARPVVHVPMHLDNGVPLVAVHVGGQGPFWFKVDTGSGPCLLSERLVARLRLPTWRVQGRLLGADGATRGVSRIAEVGTAAFGESVRFGRFRAWVLPEQDLDARGTAFAVDGILGFSVFHDLVATLDYPRRRLSLGHEALPEPDGAGVLPLSLDRGTPKIPASLGELSTAWLLDTGNDQGPTLGPADQKRLVFVAPPVSGPLLATVGGTTRAQLARLDGALKIGANEVPRPIVSIIDGAAPMLGADALRHFKITIDAANRRVRFERDARQPIEIHPRTTDGLGLRRAGEGWEVVDVVPGSPAAAAGIQIGEAVRSVETTPEGAFRVDVGTHGVWRTVVLEARVLVE